MADYWTVPKTNWLTSDGIGYADLNRIEANISANRDANFRKVQGCGYNISNIIGGQDGVITVSPGSCYSVDSVPMKMISSIVKNLTTWALGNGPTYGGMASAVTVAANTWYYIFLIMDPTDGSVEIMFDDNVGGSNVSSGTFTKKRFINSFKTAAAGGDGSFDLVEMYSDGDRVYINPNSMYAVDRYIFFTNGGGNNNYSLVTFTSGAEGLAFPARVVRGVFNVDQSCEFGLISDFGSLFTVPATLHATPPSSVARAELFKGLISNLGYADFEIIVTAAGQINLALYRADSGGSVAFAIRGFFDERLQ